MAFYRKKTVVIEAIQWTGLNREEIFEFVGHGVLWGDVTGLEINSSEAKYHVREGDWIIKGTGGVFYPCASFIFNDNYEPVDS